MTSQAQDDSEHAAIRKTVRHYLDGARSGRGDDMRPAFHNEATICGFDGDELFVSPIEALFTWNDRNGPADSLESRITSIDVAETAATVRLELENWTGTRFTDFFTLLKIDGEWKIMNKVFHKHS